MAGISGIFSGSRCDGRKDRLGIGWDVGHGTWIILVCPMDQQPSNDSPTNDGEANAPGSWMGRVTGWDAAVTSAAPLGPMAVGMIGGIVAGERAALDSARGWRCWWQPRRRSSADHCGHEVPA